MHIYRGYDTNDDTDVEALMNRQRRRKSFMSITQTEKHREAERAPPRPEIWFSLNKREESANEGEITSPDSGHVQVSVLFILQGLGSDVSAKTEVMIL